MKRPRKPPQGRCEVAALAAYNRRNKVLRGLGFASYQEYLDSPLWAEIRDRKLAAEEWRCFACGRPAGQVHHGDYKDSTLAGPPDWRNDGWARWLEAAELYAVCKTDHEWSEYYLGSKLPPEVATQRLKNRRAKNRVGETVPRAARQGRQERKAREMGSELERLLRRDE